MMAVTLVSLMFAANLVPPEPDQDFAEYFAGARAVTKGLKAKGYVGKTLNSKTTQSIRTSFQIGDSYTPSNCFCAFARVVLLGSPSCAQTGSGCAATPPTGGHTTQRAMLVHYV